MSLKGSLPKLDSETSFMGLVRTSLLCTDEVYRYL